MNGSIHQFQTINIFFSRLKISTFTLTRVFFAFLLKYSNQVLAPLSQKSKQHHLRCVASSKSVARVESASRCCCCLCWRSNPTHRKHLALSARGSLCVTELTPPGSCRKCKEEAVVLWPRPSNPKTLLTRSFALLLSFTLPAEAVSSHTHVCRTNSSWPHALLNSWLKCVNNACDNAHSCVCVRVDTFLCGMTWMSN